MLLALDARGLALSILSRGLTQPTHFPGDSRCDLHPSSGLCRLVAARRPEGPVLSTVTGNLQVGRCLQQGRFRGTR